ncbi:MAG: hypothetical protein QXT44_07125 [Candidatus Bathyarchaeia archaeon]
MVKLRKVRGFKESIVEFLQILRVILTTKWYWILVGFSLLIVLGPFVGIFLFLILPSPFNLIALVALVITWGIAAGYKDWITAKIKEEKVKAGSG